MSNFNKPQDNPLKHTKIKNAKKSHIKIIDKKVCREKCENKPCTFYCPSRVFYWENNKINILYKRCLECGACPHGCPYSNIDWNFPRGGYGVIYGNKYSSKS